MNAPVSARLSISVFVFAIVAASLSAPPLRAQTSAAKRPITDKDIFDFVWVTNPQLSPDGSRVAFTRVNIDDKRTGYETSIWMVPASGGDAPVRLTNGKHDSQPRWSPDGRRLAFVRGAEKDETGKPAPSQIALLSLAGGSVTLDALHAQRETAQALVDQDASSVLALQDNQGT